MLGHHRRREEGCQETQPRTPQLYSSYQATGWEQGLVTNTTVDNALSARANTPPMAPLRVQWP